MKIVDLKNMNLNNMKEISVSDTACTYRLSNGSVLKIFNPDLLVVGKLIDVDFERKILEAKPIKTAPEIVIPTSAVYFEKNFVGYTMPMVKGRDYNEMDSNLALSERVDLERYAKIHNKLESIIKRTPDMVFPDLCTCDNIFIDENGKIKLIDYDGIQVGKHKTVSLSTSLGSVENYYNDKYMKELGLFTKELDKKSLIVLFFLSAFNVDLNKVGMNWPGKNSVITLDDIFDVLNLDDLDFCHKVWKIFNNNEDNEYLEDDVFRIADKYGMNIVGQKGNMILKKLYKK